MSNQKLDLKSLQDYLISLLEKINAGQNQEQINEQIKLVRNLELKMVITAPMKAGKSTLLNAFIGQEIMPSHRDAMTTLPTNIVFNSQLSEEPVLRLTDTMYERFTKIISNLQKTIADKGVDWAKEKMKGYPHLESLLEKIYSGIELSQTTTGSDKIYQTLSDLNHIIRFCSKLTPEIDPFESISDFPTVETPFWQGKGSAIKESIQGKLIIVDTPGPDEADQGRLRDLVNAQLSGSSLVLVVINYLTLRSAEAAKIKDRVKKIIEARGQKNLYVVVNYVNERKGGIGELTLEEVQQIIYHEYGISSDSQVFEVSALHALRATNFLRDLDFNPTLSIEAVRQRPSAQKFAELRWLDEEDRRNALNELMKDKLIAEAEKYRQKWQFTGLLEQITTLLEGTEYRCMRTATNVGSDSLNNPNNSWSPEIDTVKKLYHQLENGIAISKVDHNQYRQTTRSASQKLRQQHNNWSTEINSLEELFNQLS